MSLFRRSTPAICAVRSCEQAARVRVSHMELAESVCHAHVTRFEHAWGQVYVRTLP